VQKMRGSYKIWQYQDLDSVSGVQFAATEEEAPAGAIKVYVKFSNKADFLANLNAIYDSLDVNAVSAALGMSAFSFEERQPFPNKGAASTSLEPEEPE
jgi:hypothetical protein